MLSGMRVRHRGSFDLAKGADRWKPFTFDQQVITCGPSPAGMDGFKLTGFPI